MFYFVLYKERNVKGGEKPPSLISLYISLYSVQIGTDQELLPKAHSCSLSEISWWPHTHFWYAFPRVCLSLARQSRRALRGSAECPVSHGNLPYLGFGESAIMGCLQHQEMELQSDGSGKRDHGLWRWTVCMEDTALHPLDTLWPPQVGFSCNITCITPLHRPAAMAARHVAIWVVEKWISVKVVTGKYFN